MTDIFKEIESMAELPASVKRETMSNLDTVKLMLDLVDLFFIKPGNAVTDSLSGGGSIQAIVESESDQEES